MIHILPEPSPKTFRRHIEVLNVKGVIGNLPINPKIKEIEVDGDAITTINCHDISLDKVCLKSHVIFPCATEPEITEPEVISIIEA